MRIKWTTLSPFCAILLFSGLTSAEKTYVYKENDGTVWYSNVTPAAQDTARFKLIEVKGRATARASCKGMTDSKLNERAAYYSRSINEFAKEYRMDPKLIKAVIRNESCFDKDAVSPAGAEGLMQLMPATAKALGVTDSFMPQQNLRGGIQYLSALVNQYENNLALALAAYNAGPGAVEKYNGVPPYAETQKYIERVMKSYKTYLRDYLVAGADQ